MLVLFSIFCYLIIGIISILIYVKFDKNMIGVLNSDGMLMFYFVIFVWPVINLMTLFSFLNNLILNWLNKL